MRVKTWVEFSKEIEVEVSIAEVMSSIAGLADTDQLPMTLDCISSVVRTLRVISDKMIASMKDNQREIVANALLEQAGRFKPPVERAGGREGA